MGSGILWKIIVTQHSPPLHQEMQFVIVLCTKRKAFIHFAQKDAAEYFWARIHLRWTRRLVGNLQRNICFCHQDDEFSQELHVLKISKDNPECYLRILCMSYNSMWLICQYRVRVLEWPACSPDLSPIENGTVWHHTE